MVNWSYYRLSLNFHPKGPVTLIKNFIGGADL